MDKQMLLFIYEIIIVLLALMERQWACLQHSILDLPENSARGLPHLYIIVILKYHHALGCARKNILRIELISSKFNTLPSIY